MTTTTKTTTPWGTCYATTCSVVGVRCDLGLCASCCSAQHKNTEGLITHRVRGVQELAEMTPEYTPETPKLVGHTPWEEVA